MKSKLIFAVLLAGLSGCATPKQTVQREREAFIEYLSQLEMEQIFRPTFYVPGTIRDIRQWVIDRGHPDPYDECGE